MANKLIVYTDGSYRDGHAGWAFVMHDIMTMKRPSVSYGSYSAINSTQAEAIACKKAIDNIDLYGKYDNIIIRTDQIELVKLTNRIIDNSVQNESNLKECFVNNEAMRIAIVQMKLGSRLKFEKVGKKNHFFRLADRYARKALSLKPDDESYWYMENTDSRPIYHECKKNSEKYYAVTGGEKLINLQEYEVMQLRVAEIDLVDTVHLETPTLNLNGDLLRAKEGYVNDRPVVVRPMEDGRFGLVSGLKRFCIAKIMDVEIIPAVIIPPCNN